MTTWTEVFLAARQWLSGIWNGIFSIEIFDGLTFRAIFIGLVGFSVGIMIFKYLLSNTHAGIGMTDTYTSTTNLDTGKTTRTLTTSHRSRKHF